MKVLHTVAFGLALVAAGMVGAALRSPAAPPAAPVCESRLAPDAPGSAGAPVVPDVPPTPSAPPKIEGVKASARAARLGVELELEVALTLAAPLQQKEFVGVKARCELEGEEYTGTGSLYLRNTPAGTSVVATRVSIGTRHAFTQLPTRCHLGFEYTSFVQRPTTRAWLGKMCWDGGVVSDAPCAPSQKRRDAGVTVSAVRVATSAQRYQTRQLGAPVDLEVSLDAELAKPLDEFQLEVAADCTLPDGTKQHATANVTTYGVHAGRPFTSRAWLFRGAQQMLDVPESCTVAVEIADRTQLVREPVAAWCWRAGDVATGACS